MHSPLDHEGVLDGSKYSIKFGEHCDLLLTTTSLSYMEMRLIIGKLLWHNDVKMSGTNSIWDPAADHANMKVYTNWIKPPFLVQLVARKDRS